MTEEQLEIARAFVACGPWVWLPGMLDTNGGRMVDPGKLLTVRKRVGGILDETWQLHCNPADYISGESEALPDITDPCTLGCILHVVRDAHGISWLTTVPLITAGGVHGWRIRGLDIPLCKSEAEALLRALQAAPG